MKVRITLLWLVAAAANVAIVVGSGPPPVPPGPSPALVEHARRRAEAERPAVAGALLQLALIGAGVAAAGSAAGRLGERPGRVAAAVIGAVLGFGAAFIVVLQLVLLVAVAIPDFAIQVLDEHVIVGWLERSFLLAWVAGIGGAPLGAALLHGGRPVDLRALGGAQLAASAASVASIAIAGWARELVLPPRPDILYPALVVIAASAAGWLRARARAGAVVAPAGAPGAAS